MKAPMVVNKNAAPMLAEALLPFARFACNEPHINDPECHNCKAKAALLAAGYTEDNADAHNAAPSGAKAKAGE